MDWYYVKEGERQGPINDSAFSLLVREGEVVPTSLVWHEGMADWRPYAELAVPASEPDAGGVAVALDQSSPAHRLCVECGDHYPAGAGLAYDGRQVCARCKPVLFARLAEGTLEISRVQYAGFWIRAAAKIVDNCLLGVCNMMCIGLIFQLVPTSAAFLIPLFQLLAALVGMIATIAYTTWFVGRFGATPGKMLFGLEVVRSGGGGISYARAFGRTFAEFISAFILYVGYFMAGFDEEKRALHDHICDTRVIRTS